MLHVIIRNFEYDKIDIEIVPGMGRIMESVLKTHAMVERNSKTYSIINYIVFCMAKNELYRFNVENRPIHYYIPIEYLNRYFKFVCSESLAFMDPNDIIDILSQVVDQRYPNLYNGGNIFNMGTYKGRPLYKGVGAREHIKPSVYPTQYHDEVSSSGETYTLKYTPPYSTYPKKQPFIYLGYNSATPTLEIDSAGIYHLVNDSTTFIISFNTDDLEITINLAERLVPGIQPSNPIVHEDKYRIDGSSINIKDKLMLTEILTKFITKTLNIDKLEIESKNILLSETFLKVLDNDFVKSNIINIVTGNKYIDKDASVNPTSDTEEKINHIKPREPYQEHKEFIKKILVSNKIDFSEVPTDIFKDTFTFTFHNGENYVLFWSGYYVAGKNGGKRKIGTVRLKELNNVFKALECLKGYDIFISNQGK